MLNINFNTLEEGMQELIRGINLRNKMGGALYWNVCEESCLRLADKLVAAGGDKQAIATIGGWELRAKPTC